MKLTKEQFEELETSMALMEWPDLSRLMATTVLYLAARTNVNHFEQFIENGKIYVHLVMGPIQHSEIENE